MVPAGSQLLLVFLYAFDHYFTYKNISLILRSIVYHLTRSDSLFRGELNNYYSSVTIVVLLPYHAFIYVIASNLWAFFMTKGKDENLSR